MKTAFPQRILGIAPLGTFSGFENSFFKSLEMQGAQVETMLVELPWFKLMCTLGSISASKSRWGLKRDLKYHTSIEAFCRKSTRVQSEVLKKKDQFDILYQIGALWNPLPKGVDKPLVLGLDYTTMLSKKRNSEWKRKPGKEQEFWLAEEIRLYRRADVICATTANAKISLVEDYGVDAEKIVVVGPGVSAPFDLQEPYRLPDYSGKRILFVGKGYRGKGLDTLLEAFQKVKHHVPDARLTVIGPSVEVKEEGVDYLGRIYDKETLKNKFYESAVFAMPSIFEPVGQVFLEAMACKLPCIGTTIDAMPELIDDGNTGYTIEPGRADQLAIKLIDLLLNPVTAKKMGCAGYKKLEEEFTWEEVGKKILHAVSAI